jgi:hypothetical protein
MRGDAPTNWFNNSQGVCAVHPNTQWTYSREVLNILDELEDEGKAIVEEIEKGVYQYRAYEEPAKLSEDAKKIVDEVVERFGKLSLDELLNYVYSLDEVKRAEVGETVLWALWISSLLLMFLGVELKLG